MELTPLQTSAVRQIT